ncbi:hypothetical protein RFI_32305 [Reticulomyxa filosa]|uniref:Uncharacterized protein n=1 Tax=Reticulomyxa filosa TaxID=46433 RepID=X6LUM8_RETFI|nr:hypothetical protein RFI_32305 [Reticulomyxa filosa]|eukprot:ETO05091.1 hypothetical protein RFI_32305 [Reticulomyxa filosa]
MSTAFVRAKQSLFKKINVTPSLLCKRWTTDNTYEGYISMINNHGFGVVAAEKAPYTEYPFAETDLNVATTRKFLIISVFLSSCISSRNTIDKTTQIQKKKKENISKSPEGNPLMFMHPNYELPNIKKKWFLSSIEGYKTMRFKGIVRNYNPQKREGIIIPTKLGYKNLVFRAFELQVRTTKRGQQTSSFF